MRALALIGLACCAAAATAQPKSDWERDHEQRLLGEDKIALPPYPRRENLVEFQVSATADFKFFIDTASLSVGKDRIVRYTLVARSPSGVENVSYEAIRCPEEHRIYAIGHADGTWAGRDSGWRRIQRATSRGWPYALARYYFCPHRDPIQDAKEGVGALRNGVHPAVRVESLR